MRRTLIIFGWFLRNYVLPESVLGTSREYRVSAQLFESVARYCINQLTGPHAHPVKDGNQNIFRRPYSA